MGGATGDRLSRPGLSTGLLLCRDGEDEDGGERLRWGGDPLRLGDLDVRRLVGGDGRLMGELDILLFGGGRGEGL